MTCGTYGRSSLYRRHSVDQDVREVEKGLQRKYHGSMLIPVQREGVGLEGYSSISDGLPPTVARCGRRPAARMLGFRCPRKVISPAFPVSMRTCLVGHTTHRELISVTSLYDHKIFPSHEGVQERCEGRQINWCHWP